MYVFRLYVTHIPFLTTALLSIQNASMFSIVGLCTSTRYALCRNQYASELRADPNRANLRQTRLVVQTVLHRDRGIFGLRSHTGWLNRSFAPQDGHPLNFHHFGGINLDKLQKNMTLERFWRTVVVNCEALPREVLPAASEAAGKRILGTFVVVDLSGFGYELNLLVDIIGS